MRYTSCLSDDTYAILLFHGVIEKQRWRVRNYTRKHLELEYFREVIKSLCNSGDPVSMDEIWLPERYADRLQRADYSKLNFVERWQYVQGIELAYSAQSVEAMPAVAPVTRLLGVGRGTPLLRETEVIHLRTDEPAALIVSHYRHEYFRLIATVRLPSNEKS